MGAQWSGHLYRIHEASGGQNALVLFPEIPSWFVIDKAMVRIFTTFFECQSESEFIDKTKAQGTSRNSLKAPDVYRAMRCLVEKYTEGKKRVPFGNLNNAVVNVSRCCNLACSYCFNRSPASTKNTNDFMSLRLAETVFENLRYLSKVSNLRMNFSGGEPFLHPELLQLVARAKHYGFFVAIVTNGTLLTPTVANRLQDAGLDELRISIDGPTAEIHNCNRGNTFDKIIAGIQSIKAAGFSTQVVLSATITDDNIFNMQAFSDFASGLGCRHNFSYLKPTGRAEGSSSCYNRITTQLSMMPRVLQSEVRHLKRTSCGIGQTTICIGFDGSVYPCAQASGSVDAMGKLSVEDEHLSLAKILAKKHSYRHVHVDCIEVCKDCDIRYICGGGCRLVAWNETKAWDGLGSDCCLRRFEVMDALLHSR